MNEQTTTPEPLTLAQIEAEPEKWECRAFYGASWPGHRKYHVAPLNECQQVLGGWRWETAGCELQARTAGSKQPYRKVSE